MKVAAGNCSYTSECYDLIGQLVFIIMAPGEMAGKFTAAGGNDAVNGLCRLA